jgi:antitoxin (DNA-binding transcriptional repressor) of toxin-antitoxin stability system
MTATVEQIQSNWPKLIALAQGGEEIVITSEGRVVAKLTGVPAIPATPAPDREKWLAELAELRESMATGKTGPTTEEILEDLRSDRG